MEASQPGSVSTNSDPSPSALALNHQMPPRDLLYPTLPGPDPADEVGLGDLFKIFWRGKWIVIGSTLVVTFLTGAWTQTIPPEYQASFQLQLKSALDSTTGTSTAIGSLSSVLGVGETGGLDYNTLILELTSPAFLQPLVDELAVQYPKLTYNSLINAGNPDESNLQVTRVSTAQILSVTYNSLDPTQADTVTKRLAEKFIQYSAEKSQSDVRRILSYLDETLPGAKVEVASLQTKLQNLQEQQDNFALDPGTRANQLGGLLQSIQQQTISTTAALAETIELNSELKQQLGFAPAEALAQSALSRAPRYQSLLSQIRKLESDLVVSSIRFQPNSPELLAISQQRDQLIPLLDAEARRILGATLFPLVASGSSQGNLNPLPVLSDTLIQAPTSPEQLRSWLPETTGEDSGGLLTGQIPSPYSTGEASTLLENGNLDPLRADLVTQYIDANNRIQTIQARQQALIELEDDLKTEIKKIPEIAKEFTNVNRDLKVASDLLLELLTSRQNLALREAQEATTWELLRAPALKKDAKTGKAIQVNPNLRFNLILGGVVGLILGVSGALASELGIRTVRKARQVRSVSSDPGLGKVPFYRRGIGSPGWWRLGSLLPTNPSAQFREAFRQIYANLRSVVPKGKHVVLTVTSPKSGAGKTTTAIYLAQAAADMGERVLLVDGHLRNPRLAKVLELGTSEGWATALTRSIPAPSLLCPTHLHSQVSVLPAGSVGSDPIALLASGILPRIIAELKPSFTMVLIDGPPVLDVADLTHLSSDQDGVLLVIGSGYSRQADLAPAFEQLNLTHTQVVGWVMNERSR